MNKKGKQTKLIGILTFSVFFFLIKTLSVRSSKIGQVITSPSYEGIAFNELKKKIRHKNVYKLAIYNVTMTPFTTTKYQIAMEKSNKRSVRLLHRKQQNTIKKK